MMLEMNYPKSTVLLCIKIRMAYKHQQDIPFYDAIGPFGFEIFCGENVTRICSPKVVLCNLKSSVFLF
jgi:hypothetical protein